MDVFTRRSPPFSSCSLSCIACRLPAISLPCPRVSLQFASCCLIVLLVSTSWHTYLISWGYLYFCIDSWRCQLLNIPHLLSGHFKNCVVSTCKRPRQWIWCVSVMVYQNFRTIKIKATARVGLGELLWNWSPALLLRLSYKRYRRLPFDRVYRIHQICDQMFPFQKYALLRQYTISNG